MPAPRRPVMLTGHSAANKHRLRLTPKLLEGSQREVLRLARGRASHAGDKC